jgi:ketosteroid isomerase-like protein
VSSSNLDLVRAMFERFDTGDRDALLDFISDDFVMEIPPSMSAEPDVYEGRAGALRYLRGFDGLIEDVRFQPLELIEEGEHVIASLRLTGRGVTSGIEVTQLAAVAISIEDGKVTRMLSHPDVASAREGLRELE